MKMRYKNISGPWLYAALALLLAANVIMGIVLMMQSRQAMRTLIKKRMLDISDSAAALLDGDIMAELTANDNDTPEYKSQLKILRAFQDNIELAYIYGIHDDGGEHFSFTIDPSDDPGEFGEPIKTTEALINASKGKADADETPYEDRWGRFYSSYSPIYSSDGRIVGIVGVDFEAEWYEDQISRHLTTIVIVCGLSTAAGIVIALAITSRIRRRFRALYNEMDTLEKNVEGIASLIKFDDVGNTAAHMIQNDIDSGETDDVAAIGNRLRVIQSELKQYLDYVHSQAYTDAMTGVNNKTAYLAAVKRLNKQIADGNAEFAVAVFDINGLKTINDNFGHEYGDRLIIDTAIAIMNVFGRENVYRIGGDEFIAVLEKTTLDDIADLFSKLDKYLEAYNADLRHSNPLTISKGADIFLSGSDTEYRQVFKQADQAMYRDKEEYYHNLKNDPKDGDDE